MRAAAYLRLSRETEVSTSIDRQRDECRRAIEARGLDFDEATDLFIDSDLSGYQRDVRRPAYEALLDGLDRYDVLVVWRLDRLYRRFTDLVGLMARLGEAGVELVSTSESLDTSTPIGQAIAGFVAAQAEQESANTSTRVSSAQQHLRRGGYWTGGQPPYGYRTVEADGHRRLAIEPDEAALLRELAERVMAGESTRAVLADWNERGERTRAGREWTQPNLSKLLRKPVIAGYRSHRPHGQDHHAIVHGDDGLPVTVADEPVLAPERWRVLVEELDRRGRRTGAVRRQTGESMLAGLVRCGECGGPMTAQRSTHASYVCQKRAGECPGSAIRMEGLDAYVGEALQAYLGPRVAERLAEETQDDERGRELEAEAARYRDLLSQLHDERLDGLYEGPEATAAWHRAVERAQDRLDATIEQLAALRAKLPERPGVLADDLPERWSKLTTTERRTVALYFLERVEVAKSRGRGPSATPLRERVTLHWRGAGVELGHDATRWTVAT